MRASRVRPTLAANDGNDKRGGDSVAVGGAPRVGARACAACSNNARRAGEARTTSRNSSRESTSKRQAVRARTVAVRGTLSISAISSKKSPSLQPLEQRRRLRLAPAAGHALGEIEDEIGRPLTRDLGRAEPCPTPARTRAGSAQHTRRAARRRHRARRDLHGIGRPPLGGTRLAAFSLDPEKAGRPDAPRGRGNNDIA